MAHALPSVVEPAAKKRRSRKRRAPAPRHAAVTCHPNDLSIKDKDGKYLHAAVVWRDHVLGPDGPPRAMTRLVLVVLSTHMDLNGYAFPSIELVALESGCAKKSAMRHLELACAEGWLKRTAKMGYAQAWRNYEYEASIPIFEGGVAVTPRTAWRDVRNARRRERRQRRLRT